jgi:integrase
MASEPYFDKSRGKWRMKWWSGVERGWLIATLCPHPGPWNKSRPPKTPPPEARAIAQKFIDLETKARHGIDVTPYRGHPLGEHLAGYRERFARVSAKGSVPSLDRAIRLFTAHCAAEVCRSYLAGRSKTVAHATMSAEKGLLSKVWTEAVQDGIVTVNPWSSVPVPGKPRDDPPPYWTKEELDTLVGGCGVGWLRDIVIVGANTGLRISAMLGLEWRNVNFERGVILVRQEHSKSGRWYEVPMSATANEVLMRRWATRKDGNPLVFPGPRSGRQMRIKMPYDRLQKLVRKLGLPDHGHYNHILRHTFATHAVKAGVPLLYVSAWLGHHSIKMTEKYSHVIPSESHRQMESFDLPLPPSPPSV